MIKIPFNEKEYKKHEDNLRKDFLAKAAAQTPEAFADIINEVIVEKIVEKEVIKEVPIEVIKELEVEKIVEVDNPVLIAEIASLKEQLQKKGLDNTQLAEMVDKKNKENEKLRKEIPKLKEAIAALSKQE